jgi:NADH-quinone oxidoreductase subunit C
MSEPASSTPAKPGASTPPAVDKPSVPALQPFSPSAILPRLLDRFPAAKVEIVTNPGPAAEHSLLIDAASAREVAIFLRDDPALRLDYCSNVTGVDWPDKEIVETKKVPAPAAPVAGASDAGPGSPNPTLPEPKFVEEKTTRLQPGYLEAVYHLFSMALKSTTPVILRLRTGNRSDQVTLPSLTPVWRSCDFQEREIYDLYGIVFDGHPDLRRLLMWDEFKDHPMRKDYIAPDDFEWEPTPHGAVLERAKAHYQVAPVAGVADPGPGSPSPATKTPEAKP